MRVYAIDWSGDRDGGRRTIWTAMSSDGHLRELANGRTRHGVALHLVDLAQADPRIVVGFDFVFSMPAWFVRHHGASSGPEFWRVVEEEGERWLSECPRPFFGRKGTVKPADVELFRRTEKEVPAIAGRTPKSVFQLAGGGHPGTGSVRGMPILKRLRDEDFRVWPFDSPDADRPLVVEIYPRLLTGEVVKTNRQARTQALGSYASRIRRQLREVAAGDENEFDAAVSAAVMDRYLDELRGLPAGDEIDRVEGRIWHPLRSPVAYRAQRALRLKQRTGAGSRRGQR